LFVFVFHEISFLKLKFLLAYNSCTGVHCDIYICAYNILSQIYCLYHSPLPPLLLGTISTGRILLFLNMNTKCVHHIHPHSPFPCAHQPPTGAYSRKRPMFPSCPSFFCKCIVIVKRNFTWILQHMFFLGERGQYEGLNSGPHTCKAVTLPLELPYQPLP
jgi:hypothetical protein